MSLISPYVLLGRNILYTSTIVDGDLDSAAKIEAINAAMEQPGVRDVVFDRAYNVTMPRTALVNGSANDIFRLPAGRIIHGDHTRPIDCSTWDKANVANGTQRYLVTARGTDGADANLTGDIAIGRTTVPVGSGGIAALGLSIGCKVNIKSDRVFIAGTISGVETQGEIATVVGIGATSFEVMPPFQDSYAVADNARVSKISMMKGIGIEGLRAIGPGMTDNAGTPIIGDRMIHLVYCDDLKMSGVRSEFFDNGNYLYSSTNGTVDGFSALFETADAATRAVNQYGLAYLNACQDLDIISPDIVGGKHGVVQSNSGSAPGITRRVGIKRGRVAGTWNYAYATHTGADNIEVSDSEALGCSGGVEAGCRGFTSRRNTVRGLRFLAGLLGTGIAINEVAENARSIDDRVSGGGFGLRFDTSAVALLSGSVGPSRIEITNLFAEDSNQDAVRINWGNAGTRHDFVLRGIQTRNCGRPVDASGYPTSGAATAANSIDIRGTAGNTLTGIQILDCNLQGWAGNPGYCVKADYCAGDITGVRYANHVGVDTSIGSGTITPVNVGTL